MEPEHEECSNYPPQYESNAFVVLLGDRRTFADFVAAFVDVGTLKPRLQFDTATLLKRKFVSESLRENERDVVWKVPIAGGELFIVLLLEHQSAIDHGMPMRLLLYMNALWQEHYQKTSAAFRRSKEFRAPPIVPIVFYTGDGVWNGATHLKDLFAHGDALEGLLPDFRFQVINFGDFAEENFAAPNNFACALLHVVWALMTGVSNEEFARIFDKLRPFWRTPELELLGAFLYHYACAEKRPEAANEMYAALRQKEDGMNTPETVRKSLFRIWMEEGEAKGEAEGEARKERQVLREQIEAIKAFFGRKGLPWDAYSAPVEGFRCHREATDFMVDLATAADMSAFLKERFGY